MVLTRLQVNIARKNQDYISGFVELGEKESRYSFPKHEECHFHFSEFRLPKKVVGAGNYSFVKSTIRHVYNEVYPDPQTNANVIQSIPHLIDHASEAEKYFSR